MTRWDLKSRLSFKFLLTFGLWTPIWFHPCFHSVKMYIFSCSRTCQIVQFSIPSCLHISRSWKCFACFYFSKGWQIDYRWYFGPGERALSANMAKPPQSLFYFTWTREYNQRSSRIWTIEHCQQGTYLHLIVFTI